MRCDFPLALQAPCFKERRNIKVINLCRRKWEKKRVEKKSLNALIPGCCVSNELGLVGLRVWRADVGPCRY